MKAEYWRLYRLLFDLVMADKGYSPEADDLRRRMDEMPPHGKKGDDQKEAWGAEVGTPLYRQTVYGQVW